MKKNHQNYDTIISSWYKLSSFLAINKLVNYKTIAWEHVTHETGGRLYRDILRRYYKNLKAIVCINTPAILHYKQYKQTIFIPNIIGKPFEDQTHINLGDKKNIISFVGRLDLEKNVMELLEIIKDAEIPNDWKVQIIGEGREREKLEKFVFENNLKNKISFLGNKDSNEILELLKQSKIFGFTSIKEGLPTVLIESMFCGNALLAYDCNYGPADIMNKKNGFLIPLHDKILFLEKLQMLINNEKILNQYMENSFEESKNWKKEEVLKNWKRLL
jgi:glycosyltransferase involved in cell wall biosynthesis